MLLRRRFHGFCIERIRLSRESAFYEILGKPQFLNNSERAIYLKLRDVVEKALAPQDLLNFQNVADIACNIVEMQRFKRAQVALINSPAVFADLLKLVFGDNPDKARQVALNYFGNDPKKADAADLDAPRPFSACQGQSCSRENSRGRGDARVVQSRRRDVNTANDLPVDPSRGQDD